MYQGFPGDYDSGSRCSSSPSVESQYISSVDSFGSPTTTAAVQDCSPLVDMPGSFVPTVTAITSSQDLQWLVQPTLISSVAQTQAPPPQQQQQPPHHHHHHHHPQPGGPMAQQQQPSSSSSSSCPVDPYDLPGPSYSGAAGGMGGFSTAPPPVRATRVRVRRSRDETLTPEEEEKRRVRRERNKLAAAKCRNRRRELTDRLQAETDQLEEEKAELESEIAELQKEKERLEFVLVAHAPACKIPYEEPLPLGAGPVEVSTLNKEEPSGPVTFSYQPGTQGPFPSCIYASGIPQVQPNPSYTSSFVFTYPEGSTCGASHQRSSSSDQSSDSLNSPSLLAL